ncbi:hypothetical protein CERSUDRAFT_84814 [Gelatoporia subvermispora B]|uniref:NADH-ubiquinone oxidoreductase 9.5 kDa subunit n=1 Tax=Ceriporiopsis subvermispora (strain B) TaxID=914234 RepID=M2PHX7_CERS8|nr:hypothetical protein CERSUDRAFT_84814 [Gelatoporia subvermispora B]
MAAVFSPFRSLYRTLQRQAHESPVIFWSCVLGAVGPAMVLVVPPIRKKLGYRKAEPIPSTYPIPRRPRRAVQGYEDE